MGANITIPTRFTAIDRFSSVIGHMAKSVRNMSKSSIHHIQRFDNRVSESFRKMGNLTRAALDFGIGTLFINSFDDLKQFETGLVGVGKTTGISGNNLKQLGQSTIELSKSMRGISTKKLLELSGVAGQMGISDSKSILKFASTLAMLEKASDIQGEEGASSIARMLKITGEGPLTVDRFASSLVGLGNNI